MKREERITPIALEKKMGGSDTRIPYRHQRLQLESMEE
jgi:hypothetical protein